MRGLPKVYSIIIKIITRIGSFCVCNASRPRLEIKTYCWSYNAAIAVEEKTLDSESTKIVKFLLVDFAS